MNRNDYPKITLYVLFSFMLACFFSMRVFNDGIPGWKHIITSDGRGYYAYLPALLIDQDPTFAKVVKREARLLGYLHYKPGYLVKFEDHVLNKYFAGEALLLFPFFLLGVLFSAITGADMTGYSFFFQIFAGLGALFYLFSGLFFLKRILENMQIRPAVIAWTLIVILFGTNLFYYSLWQPTMSHIFSFFAINGFLWFTIRAIRDWNIKSALLMGLFLGLACLIRPTNIMIILLIPFLSESDKELLQFVHKVRAKKIAGILLLGLLSVVISIQGLMWYIQTGHFAVWSYQNEGFNFGQPEIFNVLFSYRKGLFIYAPLLLISLFGLLPLLLRKRLMFFSIAGFLMISTFVVASWWNWYYGDGFGMRAFIDYYGIFAILLALLMNWNHRRITAILFIFLLTPIVALNLVQTWQYTHLVIHPNSMNAAKYHHIFMRTDSAVINCLGGNEEIADYPINMRQPVKVYENDFEKAGEGWINYSIVETSRSFSGSRAGYLDSLHQFSSGIAIKAGDLGATPASYFISGELMVWDSLPGASNGALVVLSMDTIHRGENWWQGFRLNDVPVKTGKKWRKCSFSLMLPEISNSDGILKVYIWNTQKKPMLIDDFKVGFYGRK
ncbi:MAG: hypothetical protein NTW16_03260 [Bacteroidetes bacterium]|nr:hypothetical protein [Bacteroidota bacterium]